MVRVKTAALEADLSALKIAAERAGTALACLFSCSDEYEADLIRERRAAGAYGPPPHARRWRRIGTATLTGALAFAFLMM